MRVLRVMDPHACQCVGTGVVLPLPVKPLTNMRVCAGDGPSWFEEWKHCGSSGVWRASVASLTIGRLHAHHTSHSVPHYITSWEHYTLHYNTRERYIINLRNVGDFRHPIPCQSAAWSCTHNLMVGKIVVSASVVRYMDWSLVVVVQTL